MFVANWCQHLLLACFLGILANSEIAFGKPLEGKIERNSGSNLVDTNQFNGSVNQFNGSAGAAQSEPTRLPRSAGVNTTQLDSGITGGNARLEKGTAKMDKQRPIRLPGDVSERELTKLRNYDVVVMQDRSSSMGEDEHVLGRNGEGFRKMSRWDWCREQAWDFTRQTTGIPDWRFTLVLFSSKYAVFPDVMLGQIPYIYNRSGIFIGTKLATPLGEQISQYFYRRSHGSKRPLLIAIITDGKPQDDEDLRDLIVQTTHAMRDPGEIRIVFLQVGTSDDGEEKLEKLDRKLVRKGARYDIVSVKPFQQLLETGFTRSLIDTIGSVQTSAR